MNNFNYHYWLIKIDRTAAWVLLASIFTYFISGYGMTKGIISFQLATLLHQNILPLIVIPAFAIHTFLAVRIALMRWRMWNRLTMIGLSLIYLISGITLLYFQLFYIPNTSANSDIKTNVSVDQNNLQSNNRGTIGSKEKIYTTSELAKYDGQNGNPAYAAVDGIVYNVSNVFINGIHHGYAAGQDQTDAFYTKHVKSQIEKYPVVGKLQ